MGKRRNYYVIIYSMLVFLLGALFFGTPWEIKATPAVDAEGKAVQDEPVKVLLVGNSLTQCGEHVDGRTVQGHLKKMAAASGKPLTVKTVAYGGASLRNFAGLNPVRERQAKRFLKVLKSEQWDYVVIQELSRRHYEKYEERSIPAIKKIMYMIEKYSPDAQVMQYLPRGFDFSKKKKEISSMEMECQIGAAGERLESRFGIDLIPVGMHFYRCSIRYPEITLIGADKKHPSKAGYFLSASCIYQKIFGEPPMLNESVLAHAEISRLEAEQLIGLWGEGIKSQKTEVTVRLGETYQMYVVDVNGAKVSEVRYVSLDEEVATVDDVTGEITAIGGGMTVVMGETREGWQTYCTVYVPYDVPQQPTATTEILTLADGQTVVNVQLEWTKQKNTKYAVYRAKSKKGPYELLGTVKKGAYTDTISERGTTWYYKITASNGYEECESKRTEALAVVLP